MRRKTTKELLAESLRELVENKAIDKITVKEITENCGYSQATFYRHFKDKYDLIAWSYSQGVEAIMDQIGVNDLSGMLFKAQTKAPHHRREIADDEEPTLYWLSRLNIRSPGRTLSDADR